jgi:hypothetical protein
VEQDVRANHVMRRKIERDRVGRFNPERRQHGQHRRVLRQNGDVPTRQNGDGDGVQRTQIAARCGNRGGRPAGLATERLKKVRLGWSHCAAANLKRAVQFE